MMDTTRNRSAILAKFLRASTATLRGTPDLPEIRQALESIDAVSEELEAVALGAATDVVQVPCPDCGGEGQYQEGEVSRAMAIDGGDRSLEGQPVFARCHRCRGNGWLQQTVEPDPERVA